MKSYVKCDVHFVNNQDRDETQVGLMKLFEIASEAFCKINNNTRKTSPELFGNDEGLD